MPMPLFIANWKMHGGADFCRRWAREWAREFGDDSGGNDDNDGKGGDNGDNAEVVVCPPAVYIGTLRAALSATGGAAKKVMLGAQDISKFDGEGAYTGEMSATMIADSGCAFVIIGHSERRRLSGDDDEVVAAKLRAAVAAGLRPVLCIGESEDERRQGKTAAVIHRQLAAAIGIDGIGGCGLVVAYEPVWAIGSGQTPDAAAIDEVQQIIRQRLINLPDVVNGGGFGGRIMVVYGGSVRADNVAGLVSGGGVDGVLVGGASLSAAGFAAITRMP